MEKRYFINNKVYVSKIKMPRQANKYVYIGIDYINWKKSLTELACYKSELDKIKIVIWKQIYTDRRNPIDITSITTVKTEITDTIGGLPILEKVVYFKEVESDTNESIVFAEWILQTCTSYKSSDDWHYYTDDGTIRKTTKELYEIFKEEKK
jgi:hypothetical protein